VVVSVAVVAMWPKLPLEPRRSFGRFLYCWLLLAGLVLAEVEAEAVEVDGWSKVEWIGLDLPHSVLPLLQLLPLPLLPAA
jgi:hypothetical protein